MLFLNYLLTVNFVRSCPAHISASNTKYVFISGTQIQSNVVPLKDTSEVPPGNTELKVH